MSRKATENALRGVGGHVRTETIFDGLDWTLAGRRLAGSPYSIWQLVNHMNFWQEFCLAQLRGENPPTPAHDADSWPGEGSPPDEAAWNAAVSRFRAGLDAALAATVTDLDAEVPARPERTRRETLHMNASHNSYHAGQVVMLRRMLGAWPPPTRGDTW